MAAILLMAVLVLALGPIGFVYWLILMGIALTLGAME